MSGVTKAISVPTWTGNGADMFAYRTGMLHANSDLRHARGTAWFFTGTGLADRVSKYGPNYVRGFAAAVIAEGC